MAVHLQCLGRITARDQSLERLSQRTGSE